MKARLPRVTLFGAESTGKSTLASLLARHYDTVAIPEYGRIYTETHGQHACTQADMLAIAYGHLALRAEFAPSAERVIIEDTDPLLTAVWSDILAGGHDPWFDAFDDYPDLYLFCDIDLPWERDGVRYFGDPAARQRFHEACERELARRPVKVVRITGDHAERLATAIAAIDQLLGV